MQLARYHRGNWESDRVGDVEFSLRSHKLYFAVARDASPAGWLGLLQRVNAGEFLGVPAGHLGCDAVYISGRRPSLDATDPAAVEASKRHGLLLRFDLRELSPFPWNVVPERVGPGTFRRRPVEAFDVADFASFFGAADFPVTPCEGETGSKI